MEGPVGQAATEATGPKTFPTASHLSAMGEDDEGPAAVGGLGRGPAGDVAVGRAADHQTTSEADRAAAVADPAADADPGADADAGSAAVT